MKTKHALGLVMTLPLMAALSACSVKSSGGGGDNGGGGNPPADNTNNGQNTAGLVAGPALEGKWESSCASIGNGKYAKLTYEFKLKRNDKKEIIKREVVRGEDVFDSSACAKVVTFKVNGGTYRFLSKSGNDVYEVEYNLMRGFEEGMKTHKENLQVSGKDLFVSHESSGSAVTPNIKLTTKDGVIGDVAPAQPANPSNPGTTPAPAPAPVSETFKARIGQKISYLVTGPNPSYTSTMELIAQYNESRWRMKTTNQYSSHSQSVTQDQYDPMTAAEAAKLLASCVADGGKIETITVTAGTFKTCHTTKSGGDQHWMGAVPIFGIVKVVNADGSKFELTSVTY